MSQSKKQPQEPTNRDILQAVQAIDHRLTDHIDESKQTHNDILHAINSYANDIESELLGIKSELSGIKSTHTTEMLKVNARLNSLPTKDYLDEKIADLRGDVVGSQKRTNKAVSLTVKTLERKNIFQPSESKSILKFLEENR